MVARDLATGQHRHHGHELGTNLFTRHALDIKTLSNVIPLSLTKVFTKVNRPSPLVNMDLRLEQMIKNHHNMILDNPCLHVTVPGILHMSIHVMVMGGEQGDSKLLMEKDCFS